MVEKAVFDPTLEARRILRALAPYNKHAVDIKRNRSALLVIDMQNAFLDPRGSVYLPAGAAIIKQTRELTDAFRAAKRPVFYTRHAEDAAGGNAGMMARWWGKSSPQEGTWESEILEELAPRPGDVVIPKIRYSAFVATDLEQRLREARVEDVVIAGVMTNLCCETTARDAFMRDYRVFVCADATAAPTLAMHEAALLNLSYGFAVVTTCAAVARALRPK